MKIRSGLLAVLGLVLLGHAPAGAQENLGAGQEKPAAEAKAGADDIIAAITAYREGVDKKVVSNRLVRRVVVLEGGFIKAALKQRWETMEAHYDGDRPVRIRLSPHKGISRRTEEFYLKDGKLVFVRIQDRGPKREGRDIGEPGKEFYFDRDRLIRYVDRSDDKGRNHDSEMRMYESRLPYETEELLEILDNVSLN